MHATITTGQSPRRIRRVFQTTGGTKPPEPEPEPPREPERNQTEHGREEEPPAGTREGDGRRNGNENIQSLKEAHPSRSGENQHDGTEQCSHDMPTRRKSRHTPHSHAQHSTPKQGLKKPQWKNSFCTRNPQHPASRRASRNTSKFLFAGPIAQLYGAKSFESKHPKRQHQP